MNKIPRKYNGYWSKELCLVEALKYSSRKEFELGSKVAYYKSLRKGWLSEICLHMQLQGSDFKRLVYAYIFSDNSIYVGLTFNLLKRNWRHLFDARSSVYQHSKKTGLIPECIKLTDFLNKIDAAIKENEFIDYYKNNNFNILNQRRGGGLGGNIIFWTKDKCRIEALKYTCKSEMNLNSSGAYNAMKKNKWINELCSHMARPIKQKWTFDMLLNEASDCKSRSQFKYKNPSAYTTACMRGILDIICIHMK